MRIVEVGPRDGLQNESVPIPTDVKLRFIHALLEAGLKDIEATSFVSPKWVPQLADAAELWPQLPPGPRYSALVPNRKGLARAMEVGVRHIALFTAASEAFTLKNINMTIEQSLEEFSAILETWHGRDGGASKSPPRPKGTVADGWFVPSRERSGADQFSAGTNHLAPGDAHGRDAHGTDMGETPMLRSIRAYVSTAFECPYAGRVSPGQVVDVVDKLFAMGVDEVSLGDTIGVAVPKEVKALSNALDGRPKERIAWHFHDTNGTAIANVAEALELGYGAFDSSAGGLGGCPYAPGAGGNLATEDLAYFLERSGISLGLDLDRLAAASLEVLGRLGRPAASRAQVAALARAARCAT